MTVVAGVAARDVRRVLAGRRDAVVAGTAGAQDLRVIHGIDWCPYGAVMAVFTDAAGLYMGGTFARGFHAIVATGAVAGDTAVIEGRW